MNGFSITFYKIPSETLQMMFFRGGGPEDTPFTEVLRNLLVSFRNSITVVLV